VRIFTLLRIYRVFKGYSLKEMAEQLGVSPRHLAAIESGKVPDGETTVKVIAWSLGSDAPEIKGKEKKLDAWNSSEATETQSV